MRTQSERTYGSRLRNAYTMVAVLQAIPNYYTDQPELMPSNFFALLQTVDADNVARAAAEQDYRTSTAQRQKLFKKDPDSISKLLLPLKSAVLARYGKNSTELSQIISAIEPLRAKAPAQQDKTDANGVQLTVSQSQLSYGSMTKSFKELVTKLERFNNYDSSRSALTIPALKAQLLQAETLNTTIDNTLVAYDFLQARRIANYQLISDRANQIKALLLSLYGVKSAQYKAIAKLSV